MTEIVIRFDPERALQAMVCGARHRIEQGARYVERTWRTMNGLPVVTRLVYADRRTHIKIAMGAVGALSLLVIYSAATAITATPEKNTLAQRFDEAVADTKAHSMKKGDSERVFRKIDMSKLAALDAETRMVRTERIVPHEPPTMAIAAAVPLPVTTAPPVEEETVQPRPRRVRQAAVTHHAPTRGDICTRHNLRKVVTRGGKSWRCAR